MDRSRTKQVCTIGPASVDRIADLVAAGMDVARVNFSHGSPDDHRNYVHTVRSAAHAARRSVAVMVDLPGPKLRLGDLPGGELRLATGASFSLLGDESADASTDGASVPSSSLATQLQVGDRVLLADGAAELRVTAVEAADVRTEVVNGGVVRSHSGVNVPSERLAGDGLTDDDRAALPRALELRADLIAQSFVRSADDVRALRRLLPADGPRLIAKIETRAAIDNFDDILAEADGIMVARGDLGVDVPFEDVPLIQKDLLERAANADKFTIVATQMLESMTAAPRPTRAEVSDVANAVLDGADAVMLSAETAIGAFPVETLQAMERICARVEDGADYVSEERDESGAVDPARAMVLAAASISGFMDADAIWCFTRSGRTAEMLSMTRPGVPIVAFTLSPVVARRLAIRRGVIPLVLPTGNRQSAPISLIERMSAAWRAQRGAAHHERVLLVTTSRQANGINRLEVHQVAATVAPTPAPSRPTERRQPPPPRQAPAQAAAPEASPPPKDAELPTPPSEPEVVAESEPTVEPEAVSTTPAPEAEPELGAAPDLELELEPTVASDPELEAEPTVASEPELEAETPATSDEAVAATEEPAPA